MDYNRITEGTTVYLPVFHPGALLFVGDGHAAQGDGELAGNALETSLDVVFQVDLIKGESAGVPRAESVVATAMNHDIAEVVDGDYHVVARLRKLQLAGLAPPP